MRSTPLNCQNDQRVVQDEGELWLMDVRQAEGSASPTEMNLYDQMSCLYALPQHIIGGKGDSNLKWHPCARVVAPVQVETFPSNLIGWSPLWSWPSATWVPKTLVYYQAWRETKKLVDSYHWNCPDMELDSYGQRDGRKWNKNLCNHLPSE